MAALGFRLNQTMMRIKDPKLSIPFYTKYFDMKVIDELHFPGAKFSLYFLASITDKTVNTDFKIGSEEAKIFRQSGDYGCCLELTHNHGTENDPEFGYHNGNSNPRGFGHIGFLVDNVYDLSERMLGDGVKFQKKPDDGNMKGLAFALDPDGYWVEMIKRSENAKVKNMATFQQVMLRITNAEASLNFYQNICAMTLLQKLDFPQWKFSLYFMAHLNEEEKKNIPGELGSEERTEYLWAWEGTTVELTHNHESEEKYANGNVEPHRGFGHIAFMVDDVYSTTEYLEKKGVKFQKKPNEGRMKGLAFALDPDNYWVELISRGSRSTV